MRWYVLLLAGCGQEVPGEFALQPDLSQMVAFEAGSFEFGHPDQEPGPYGQRWKENEMPAHTVSLSAYHLDPHEITIGQWAQFLNEAGREVHYHPKQHVSYDGAVFTAIAGIEQRPINYVTWYDATVYCSVLGKRLPTEAEWERAAKGIEEAGQRWPWADTGPNCMLANYFTGTSTCESHTMDVGSYSPEGDTSEGLSDMAGNVAEWTRDRYDRYTEASVTDPTGAQSGPYRVLRGGGFRDTEKGIRTMARVPADPASRAETVGFRCAY